MRIKVEYTGPLRSAVGTGTEMLEVDGSDLGTLMGAIIAQHGNAAASLLLDGEGSLRPELIIAVNDQQVRRSETPTLHDGDLVTILHPISGG